MYLISPDLWVKIIIQWVGLIKAAPSTLRLLCSSFFVVHFSCTSDWSVALLFPCSFYNVHFPLQNLIERCLVRDPEKRPSSLELASDIFII